VKNLFDFFPTYKLHFYVTCLCIGERIPPLMLFAREFVQCEFGKHLACSKSLFQCLKERSGSILNGPDPFEKERRRRRRRRRHLLHKLPQKMRKFYPHGSMLY
jgi:hypothetical protein